MVRRVSRARGECVRTFIPSATGYEHAVSRLGESLHVDHAHAARAARHEAFHVAQRWHLDAVAARDRQDGLALGCFQFLSVDLDGQHVCFFLKAAAIKGVG
jgi:hypothetical protein